MVNKSDIKQEVRLAKEAVLKAGLSPVTYEEMKKLAELAADAYQDYPLFNWITGGYYEVATSKKIMEISVKTMLEDGVVYADSENPGGYAVWMPPGFNGSKVIPFMRNGGIGLVLHAGPKIIGRLLTYENYAMKLKEKYTKNNDWYLYNLFVAKSRQKNGIASKLMRPMLDFCNGRNRVCYLETNKESNVAMYEHFGFSIMQQGVVPKSQVQHYAMVHSPH